MPPPRKRTATPATETAAPTTSNVVSLPGAHKPGRSRYVRLFPERIHLAFEALQLTEKQFCGWVRLVSAYVFANGQLLADDHDLAWITRMGRHWPALRDKLISAGLGRIEGGRWIDDDQDVSLGIQRRQHARAAHAAAKRWGGRDA